MNPQDDPEQRIRDLEQPLADRAYTSELPTGQTYSYTAQLPPPVYPDAPYAPAPPSGTGNRGWLIIVGVVAFVVMCTAAVGAGVYLSSRGSLTAGTPTTGQNTYSGGGSLGTTSPGSTETTSPSEPAETTAPQATTATDAPPPPGGPLSVSGVGSNRDIACNNSVVSISGVSNIVTISGHCASVTVSGIENQVTLDSADTISASGFDNRITYHQGAPQVDNAGGSNVISQG